MTTKTIGPSKSTTARAISAPYSSWRRRSDSGLPSNPDRLASTTTGRLPDADRMARATFLDDSGYSVPPAHSDGPSTGTPPSVGAVVDSIPIRVTAWPPMRDSQTTAVLASAMVRHRSRTASPSTRASMTERMANASFGPG